MARTAIQTLGPPTTSRSGSGTTTTYHPVTHDIMIKSVTVIGINPGSNDGDTVRVQVDHSANSGNTYTAICDTTVDEYNDTDDTASLGTAGTDPDVRTVGTSDWGTLSFPGVRVAADRHIRIREVWTGTVTDGQVQINVNYEVLNDTIGPGA